MTEAYKTSRAAFIDDDRSLRRDRGARSQAEIRADQIVRSIRVTEASTIWTQEHESPHPFPGMEFLTGMSFDTLMVRISDGREGRDIIVKTELFALLSKKLCTQAASKMPKGALLHCHLDATVNATVLLKLALRQPALHVSVSERVTTATIGSLLPTFRALPQNEFSNVHGITEESYIAGTWVSLTNARKNFDGDLGGPEGFDRWVIGSMMINPTEAYVTHNTIKKVLKSLCP
ncbi:hypothetical protein C0991_010442 [Blastosporella zonata]|nr:hypothetical protein C0991_010442 [Blastosporella zonata]